MKVYCYVVWLKGYQGGGRQVGGRMREWAIGILQMNDSAQADLGDEVVVEKQVGGGGYSEQN